VDRHFLEVFDHLYERGVAMKTRQIAKRKFKKLAAIGGSSLGLATLSLRQPSKAARDNERHRINLMVNGQPYQLEIGNQSGEIGPSDTLAYTLRETLGLTGTKIGCDHGACGACTVLMDGKAILSCMVLTIETDGRSITTVEGLRDPNTGRLDPLQQAFIDHTAFQCGFCTPGILMSAKALLAENPSPTEQEVKEGLSGNYCRCISHYHVLDAVRAVIRQRGVKNDPAV
jgi:aerobic-type carbon monoxide dehydrogenase small subunit (CoxS/CutS family)